MYARFTMLWMIRSSSTTLAGSLRSGIAQAPSPYPHQGLPCAIAYKSRSKAGAARLLSECLTGQEHRGHWQLILAWYKGKADPLSALRPSATHLNGPPEDAIRYATFVYDHTLLLIIAYSSSRNIGTKGLQDHSGMYDVRRSSVAGLAAPRG